MKRPALLLAASLALLLALLLAACGDDAGAPSEPDATAATAVAATVSTAGTPESATAASGVNETPIPAASEVVTSTYPIPTSQLPLVRFQAAAGSVELPVEVPPRSEYAIGLSGRASLEGRGMLFYRENFGQTGFWMKNTHIDLDIAFVDADREILLITTMIADTEDIHRPDSPYVAAIEAPAGWYAEHGIMEGHPVEYLFDLESTVTD